MLSIAHHLTDASQRIMHLLHNLEKKIQHHQTICIVSHRHIIQGVIAIIRYEVVDDFTWYMQPNASYSVFDLINGRCAALKWGLLHIYVIGNNRYSSIIQGTFCLSHLYSCITLSP